MNAVLQPVQAAELEQQRRVLRLNPRDANAHALLGVTLLRHGQVEDGAASLVRALELNPKLRGLHGILGAAYAELQRDADAAAYYAQALRFQDDAADLHQGLAHALLRLGRPLDAEASARRAVELAPGSVQALLCLSTVLHAQQRFDDTIAVLRDVLALDPAHVDARYDVGGLLHRQHRYAEAIACYRDVTAVRPDHLAALRHMGLAQRTLRQYREAIDCLERAYALTPADANLLTDLGATYHESGALLKAAAMLRRALELDPDNEHALRALSHTAFTLGEWKEALALSRRVLEVAPDPYAHSMMLFILSHCCLDPDELTREHFAYGERWAEPLRSTWEPHLNERDPQRPIRVGIVSADLYNHAVTRFIAPVIEALHDSTHVELHIYYNNTIEDAMSRHMRTQVAGWTSIYEVDDETVARQIRADGMDILIDLSGHSALNRLPLFARRPAPVQATWTGYAGTTGMEAMDYVLCDQFLVPEGRYDDQFREQIVRLPLGAPFLPDTSAPDVNPLPALANGYLTFGSFHRASKLSRDVVAQWARLLHAVPNAKMLLGGMQDGADDNLIGWFEQEGIARERLLLRPRAPMGEYLRQHYDVDVCLCPFPYTGSTTIGHALWMGVPTLATVGATNPSHASVCFMAHLGLSTFITEDEDTYVKLGVFLAQNTQALAAMRASMRERFLNSVLGYPGVASAGIELALRRMWQHWCSGAPAAPLRVRLADLAPETSDEQASEEAQA
jgi:predicted O-linked N-acetylglucosamine transferase (SPINDLY family)